MEQVGREAGLPSLPETLSLDQNALRDVSHEADLVVSQRNSPAPGRVVHGLMVDLQ